MSISFFSIPNAPLTEQTKGRIILMSLILLFVLPALAAHVILSQNWYQSGVTNRGILLAPSVNYQSLGIEAPVKKSWHFGYLVPEKCDAICRQQIFLLVQSHIALGKYQPRVTPVLYISQKSDVSVLSGQLTQISVGNAFTQQVLESEYLIVDPLGQLVMRYPEAASETELINQSKDVLFDFRKLLKLSRVG